MNVNDNKQLMQDILSDLSNGNYETFFESMSDDMRWTWMGSNNLSKTFNGKKSVVNELWGSVKTIITQPYKFIINRLIAEGDYVVIEGVGQNMTIEGKPYNNKYCWVCHIVEKKLKEVNEYMDTELVIQTFTD
jgi:ketosteroid isomerase-like protein